jgi:hypothetical protein
MKAAPCTVHYFAVTSGAAELESVGKQIAEGTLP